MSNKLRKKLKILLLPFWLIYQFLDGMIYMITDVFKFLKEDFKKWLEK